MSVPCGPGAARRWYILSIINAGLAGVDLPADYFGADCRRMTRAAATMG
jgi:hypothetical protein